MSKNKIVQCAGGIGSFLNFSTHLARPSERSFAFAPRRHVASAHSSKRECAFALDLQSGSILNFLAKNKTQARTHKHRHTVVSNCVLLSCRRSPLFWRRSPSTICGSETNSRAHVTDKEEEQKQEQK